MEGLVLGGNWCSRLYNTALQLVFLCSCSHSSTGSTEFLSVSIEKEQVNGFYTMEHLVNGGHSFIIGSSSGSCRRGRFSCIQGLVLWFLMFSLQISCAVSKRNLEIIDPTTPTQGVWNKTLLKDTGHCLNFHEANASSFFFYWPEDSFQYCCQGTNSTTNDSISSYRYSMYGNPIIAAPYFDLGLIDECLPYYTEDCLHLYDSYMASPVYFTVCEWNDVIHLYNDRFWRLIFGKYGLAMTALPLIGFLQLSVSLVIALEVVYWRYWRSKQMEKTGMSFQKLKDIFNKWINGSWKNAWMDWVHLCLLSIIGNGLVEAVGRTDPLGWQAILFHRYSRVYLALSVILWCSSFLHQVTQWIAVDKKVTENLKRTLTTNQQHRSQPGDTAVQISQNNSNSPPGTTNSNTNMPHPAMLAELKKLLKEGDKSKDPVAQLKKLLRLSPDWKWQPIAAQTAILFCLWAYLTYPNYDDGLSSTLLGFLVQAASPWSGLYACRVLFLTLPFLLKKVFNVHHIRHLPKHLLHRYRKSKQAGSQSKEAKEQQPHDKELPEWLQWGRVLCCLGCCWKAKPLAIEKIDPQSATDSDE